MVQISVDTEKDSPEMIAKLIEVLNAHLSKNQSTNNFSSSALPSSAPASYINESSTSSSSSGSLFDVFGAEDRPNNQQTNFSNSVDDGLSSSSGNPFSMFDEPEKSTTESNNVAGYADNDLFNAFSSDTPTTNFRAPSTPDLFGIDASFQSAQSLLDDNFNPITDDEDTKEELEEKSSNFFNFEQY